MTESYALTAVLHYLAAGIAAMVLVVYWLMRP